MSRTFSVALLALAGGLLLSVGCNPSTRYPANLKYPVREDILVAEQLKDQPTRLPSPGQLDESIKAALKKQENAKSFDPAKLKSAEKAALREALDDAFGTPLRPRVPADPEDAEKLKLNYEVDNPQPFNTEFYLANGSELYRKHCMHCHGVAGDGRGPTAPWLHPHPRDYRQGEFKYISSASGQKPRLADLRRVLHHGLEGTSMPAFALLPPEEVEAMIGYVMHLSIRGEAEYKTMSYILGLGDDRTISAEEITTKVNDETESAVRNWARANERGLNTPPEYPDKFLIETKSGDEEKAEAQKELHDSIRRGHELFLKDGICITCHFDYGRQSAYRYDSWGTLVRPRDLTVPMYRGGRRPVDLYWRITSGITPSGMPAFDHGKAKIDGKPATPEAAWDLVNFVQALPYPHMLPPDLRKTIYGRSEKVLKPGEKLDK